MVGRLPKKTSRDETPTRNMRNQKIKAKPMNAENTPNYESSARSGAELEKSQTLVTNSNERLGRRTFMKRLGLGGAALVPATTLLAGRGVARAAGFGGGLPGGDGDR